MKQYLDTLEYILEYGKNKTDRTGIGTRGIFGHQMRFDLTKGFPAVTTKKLAWKAVVGELLWFLEGSTDERRLAEIMNNAKKTIWTENANAPYWKPKAKFPGDLGKVYGYQWRKWGSESGNIDQIQELINNIKKDPYSRRHIISAWNVGQLNNMALPPCHVLSQFNIIDNTLNCLMYQRSADIFLGSPFNIASYSLLTHMIAQICDLQVGEFVYSIGDAHIYNNHLEQVHLQLSRNPLPLPTLWLNPNIKNIDDFKMEDIQLIDYQSHESIVASMAV